MDATKVTLEPFNLDMALYGASIGWKEESNVIVATDFRKESETVYTYNVDGVEYHCDKEGKGKGNRYQLYILNMGIEQTKGTAATRTGESGVETIQIEALEPRETFACYALVGILNKMPNVLHADNFQIGAAVKRSFEIAQLMMQEAARVRAETPENSSQKQEIDLNPELLTSTTDKILYNINVNLSHISSQEKAHFDDIKANGIKISGTPKVDIALVSASAVPVSGNVGVSGNVNVDNTIVVTGSVAVNNTVDVNVTNFPESSGT